MQKKSKIFNKFEKLMEKNQKKMIFIKLDLSFMTLCTACYVDVAFTSVSDKKKCV